MVALQNVLTASILFAFVAFCIGEYNEGNEVPVSSVRRQEPTLHRVALQPNSGLSVWNEHGSATLASRVDPSKDVAKPGPENSKSAIPVTDEAKAEENDMARSQSENSSNTKAAGATAVESTAVQQIQQNERVEQISQHQIADEQLPKNNSVQQDSQPLVSVPQNTQPLASVPQNSQPLASVQQNSQPLVSVPQNSQPLASVQQNSQPQASEQQNSQPLASVQQNSQPLASVPQNSQPLASVPQNSQPLASVQQNSQPLASEQQNSQPLASVPQNSQPLASVQQNSQPLASEQQNSQPLASEQQNSQPLASVPQNSQPLASVPQNSQPLASEQQNSQPLASVPQNSQPLASVPQNSQPLASEQQNSQPLASVPQNSQPLASEQQNSQPLASVPQNSQPLASVPQNSQPLASEQQNSQPLASVPQNSQPLASEQQNSQPLASVPQNSQPQASVQQNSQPQASVPQNTQPLTYLQQNSQPHIQRTSYFPVIPTTLPDTNRNTDNHLPQQVDNRLVTSEVKYKVIQQEAGIREYTTSQVTKSTGKYLTELRIDNKYPQTTRKSFLIQQDLPSTIAPYVYSTTRGQRLKTTIRPVMGPRTRPITVTNTLKPGQIDKVWKLFESDKSSPSSTTIRPSLTAHSKDTETSEDNFYNGLDLWGDDDDEEFPTDASKPSADTSDGDWNFYKDDKLIPKGKKLTDSSKIPMEPYRGDESFPPPEEGVVTANFHRKSDGMDMKLDMISYYSWILFITFIVICVFVFAKQRHKFGYVLRLGQGQKNYGQISAAEEGQSLVKNIYA